MIIAVVRSIAPGEHAVGGFVTIRFGAGSNIKFVVIVLSQPEMVFKTDV